jgi:hypothetical protein
VSGRAGGILGAPLSAEGGIVGYGCPLFHLHPEQPEREA